MPTTSPHALRYPAGSADANVPLDLQHLAEDVDDALDAIAPTQITGGASGKLIVVDGSNIGQWKSLSGDATLAASGALTIANDAVTTAKIANTAVTGAKIDNATIGRTKLTAATIQTNRTPTGSIASGAYGQVTVTWDTAFADTNYTIQAAVAQAGTAVGLQVHRVSSYSTTGAVILVANFSGGSLSGSLHTVAFHD